MFGQLDLLHSVQFAPALAVRGIAVPTNAAGTRTIAVKLNHEIKVTLTNGLYVPGMAVTLVATHWLHAIQGLVTILVDKCVIFAGDRAVATATKLANGLYQVDGTLLACEMHPFALAAAAASHTQSLPT